MLDYTGDQMWQRGQSWRHSWSGGTICSATNGPGGTAVAAINGPGEPILGGLVVA